MGVGVDEEEEEEEEGVGGDGWEVGAEGEEGEEGKEVENRLLLVAQRGLRSPVEEESRISPK